MACPITNITKQSLGGWDAQAMSPIFTLQAELRTYVYELVLTVKNKYDRPKTDLARWPPHVILSRPKTMLVLLSLCKLIYLEAAGIFYQQNRIAFPLPSDAAPWNFENFVNLTSHLRLAGFRNVTINVVALQKTKWVCEQIANLPNLKILRIESLDLTTTADEVDEHLAEFCKAVSKLDGLERIEFATRGKHCADVPLMIETKLNAALPKNAKKEVTSETEEVVSEKEVTVIDERHDAELDNALNYELFGADDSFVDELPGDETVRLEEAITGDGGETSSGEDEVVIEKEIIIISDDDDDDGDYQFPAHDQFFDDAFFADGKVPDEAFVTAEPVIVREIKEVIAGKEVNVLVID